MRDKELKSCGCILEESAPVDVGKDSLRMWEERAMFEQRDCVQAQMGSGEQEEEGGRTGQRGIEDAEAKQEWLEQELAKESTEHGKDSLDWKRVTW